jgi:trimethylamine---corrinoid protein Co-methyltransferase
MKQIRRPKFNLLNNDLMVKTYKEALQILSILGIEINNENVVKLLKEHDIKFNDKNRAIFTQDVVEKALKSTPSYFNLYNVTEKIAYEFYGNNCYFNPGSAALNILDYSSQKIKPATTNDYIDYVKVISQLDNIEIQSTAIIPSDIPDSVSDIYRLFLSLLYCEKPVVTGCFSANSFEIMKELQLIIRETEEHLKNLPLTIFSCCPTSPLKWNYSTSQNLIDCAKYNIPVEFIAMPLSGFMAPVTLVGTLIQHTAETLSGIVISQFANPGTPILYGGSPAIFDVRYETTPMGAIETMMIDCAYNEIGKWLRLPTQAYISFSDAKQLDAQAGLETGIGATLAAMSGINSISGPGMLDFESCQSLEKLVLDNEICGMTQRLTEGISPKEDFPSIEYFKELLNEKSLIISDHTMKYRNTEYYTPGKVIDRKNRGRWEQDGSESLNKRAHDEVKQLIKNYTPSKINKETKKELVKLMKSKCSEICHEDILKTLC